MCKIYGVHGMKSLFSQRLEMVMKETGVNQARLSELTGIRQSSISDYLTGKYSPKQDKIITIANKLQVNTSWLMGYDDNKQLKKTSAIPYTDPEVLRYASILKRTPSLRELVDLLSELPKKDLQVVSLFIKALHNERT